MKETKKKREWIKNAAIVFLVIMLLLTFFSNTIMNYSLPEVATVYVQSGSITAKVRGNGVVTASDPYNVVINESRVVSGVNVRQGDVVEKGDVILTLEDKDSTELEEAQKTLNDLQAAFDKALLSGDVSADVYANVKNGNISSVAAYRSEIDELDRKVEAAQKKVDAYQTSVTNLQNQIAILEATVVDTSAEKKAVENATATVTDATNKLTAAQSVYDSTKATYEACGMTVAEAQAALDTAIATYGATSTEAATAQTNLDNVTAAFQSYSNASTNLTNVTNLLQNAKAALIAAEGALSKKQATATGDAVLNSFKLQLTEEQTKLTAAQKELTDAQENKTEQVTKIQQEMTFAEQYEAIQTQKEKVDSLRDKSIGSTVVAPVSGTITTINYTAGQTTTAGEPVAVMQVSGKGYMLSFSVTTEQAKKLNVGDIADISNSWYYSNISATLTAIKPDPTNPASNKLLEFSIDGTDIYAGTSLSLSVGQKSANYDLIVPSSAIREDSNGKYVLIVESKSTPLGNRYIATRVNVEVVASDETQSAITGALYGWEYVITTSTKPVEDGKQVRLAD